MFYLGIDIGKFHHAAALINEQGKLIASLSSFANTRSGFQSLLHLISAHLPPTEQLRVGMEATGPYWKPLAGWLSTKGWLPVILNPIKTASLRNYGIRGSKTDSIDSFLIANTLRMEGERPRPLLPKSSEELRHYTRLRSEMSEDRNSIALRVASLEDTLFPELLSFFPKTISPSCLAVLSVAPTPSKVLELGQERLTALLHKASGGKLNQQRAKQIMDKAAHSVAITSPAAEQCLALLLERINLLNAQLKVVDQNINKLYEEADVHFTSIGGVGILSAATILAEYGSVTRFSRAEQMVAFAGIDPKLRNSGMHQGQVHISKRGPRYLRRALYLACQGVVRNDEYFHSIYQRHRDNGKSYKEAIIAVVNRFIHVLYAMWRDNRPYYPLTSV